MAKIRKNIIKTDTFPSIILTGRTPINGIKTKENVKIGQNKLRYANFNMFY